MAKDTALRFLMNLPAFKETVGRLDFPEIRKASLKRLASAMGWDTASELEWLALIALRAVEECFGPLTPDKRQEVYSTIRSKLGLQRPS